MAHADPFNVITPAGTDDPRDGDDRIRELKRAIFERVTLGGMFWDSGGSPDDDAGKIACGVIATNKWYVYETDKSTIAIDLDDSAKTLTVGDGIDGSVSYTMVADIGHFGDVNIDTDLTVAGNIVTPNLDRPVISGGTMGREFTSVNIEAKTTYNVSGSDQTILTTSVPLTTSTHDTPPSRTFLCLYTGIWAAQGGAGTDVFGVWFERDLESAGFTTTGFLGAMFGTTEDRINVQSLNAGITEQTYFFMDWFSVATTAETLSVRLRVGAIATQPLDIANSRLMVIELLQAEAT